VEKGRFTDAPGEGLSTDHVDDLGDADVSYYDSGGSYHAGYDADGDGQIGRTLVDVDGDGRIDVYSYDRNGNGVDDLVLRDTNHDGHIDRAETYVDGHPYSEYVRPLRRLPHLLDHPRALLGCGFRTVGVTH
jgi:hypothetical protein